MNDNNFYRKPKSALTKAGWLVMGLLLLFCVMLLAGCANDRQAVTCDTDLPTGLTTCTAPQPYPDPATATQADAAAALVDAEAAWEDCSGKLQKIPAILAACAGKKASNVR